MKKVAIFSGIILSVFLLTVNFSPAASGPITLRFQTMLPRGYPLVDYGHVPFARELERRTNGRVKVDLYFGTPLGPAPEAYDRLLTGATQVEFMVPAYTPGVFPMTGLTELPFTLQTSVQAAMAMTELYNKGLIKGFEKVKVLYFLSATTNNLVFREKRVATLEDMKGLKVRTPGGLATDSLKAWGAVPVMLPYSDVPMSVEKGIIDGVYGSLTTAVSSAHVQETCKDVLLVYCGTVTGVVAMNLDTWNKLPPDIQAIIERLSFEVTVLMHTMQENYERGLFATLDKAGMEVIKLSPEEKDRWVKAVMPLISKWVKDLEAKGLPGKACYDEYREILSRWNLKIPVLP